MKYIESFMLGKIGIDILDSDAADIKQISNYIESHYVNFIEKPLTFFDGPIINTLYDYYIYLLNNDTKSPWQVLVYEKGLRTFNGYRGMSVKQYRDESIVMTAEEILEKKSKEITENDIEGLLCLK